MAAPVEVMVMSGGALSQETILSFQTFITQQQAPARGRGAARRGGGALAEGRGAVKRVRILTSDVTEEAKRKFLDKTPGDVEFYKLKGEVGRGGTGNSRSSEFVLDPVIRRKVPTTGRVKALVPHPPPARQPAQNAAPHRYSTAAIARGALKRPTHHSEKLAQFVATDLPELKKGTPAAQVGPKMPVLEIMNAHQHLAALLDGIERALQERLLTALQDAGAFKSALALADCVDATQALPYVKDGAVPELPYLPRASNAFSQTGRKANHWMPVFLLFTGDGNDAALLQVGALTIAALQAHLYPSALNYLQYVISALQGRQCDLHISELAILSHTLVGMARGRSPHAHLSAFKALALKPWFAENHTQWIDRAAFMAELKNTCPALAEVVAP
eukprot:TRINITY_DN9174_c0_g1_i1.p1 TRINITY_DN9174_c0_g1~~TRINITY_DN9174_c0_g1_i1.p1  ORF type:complete len:389 (+),score=124.90 TRINITY_DN9174_c0_g1_i1:70-1236(+)